MSAEVSERYAAYYDLLYREKDYEAEAEYVTRTLRDAAPTMRTLLEFGSGTGRHGRLLAARGFEVLGIERSKSMVAAAQAAPQSAEAGSFNCQTGDISTVRIGRTFDAVIALFHVMSYQTTDTAIRRTFANAAMHLRAGGLFLFDVWHGPAVLKQAPDTRVKRVADANIRLTRTAKPELRSQDQIVIVRYTIVAESLRGERSETFEEEHRMRYFFPEEIASLAR